MRQAAKKNIHCNRNRDGAGGHFANLSADELAIINNGSMPERPKIVSECNE